MPFAPVGTPAPPSRALPRMAIALLACLALYGIDLACMATVPATGFDFASGFAVPFDLMVFVPAVFYLLVVRRYRLSPLLVLPVIWLGLIAEARAVVLNPLLVDDVELVARWGMLVCERIPLDRIARVGSQDPAVPKRELLNLAAMGGQALWIELAEPLEVRGLTGKPRLVRAIKTTPDDAAAFKDALRPRS